MFAQQRKFLSRFDSEPDFLDLDPVCPQGHLIPAAQRGAVVQLGQLWLDMALQM